MRFRADLPELLRELATRFEFVWATAWQDSANLLLAPALDLPELPVLRFRDPAPGEVGDGYLGRTWKLPSVRRFAGERALAWIDDDLHPDAYAWAARRAAPAKLITTEPARGLTDADVRALLAFARAAGRLSAAPAARAAHRMPARRWRCRSLNGAPAPSCRCSSAPRAAARPGAPRCSLGVLRALGLSAPRDQDVLAGCLPPRRGLGSLARSSLVNAPRAVGEPASRDSTDFRRAPSRPRSARRRRRLCLISGLSAAAGTDESRRRGSASDRRRERP